MDKKDTTVSRGSKPSGPKKNPPCLVVISGKELGKKIPLNRQKMLVGREPTAHIPLDEETVSRRHAEFHTKKGRTIVKDLQSKNGLYVNDTKVIGSTLKNGDLIRIGDTVFKYLSADHMESGDRPLTHP
ncbi:MAG: FHA domain-containing protein [Nitrospiria bacterium]